MATISKKRTYQEAFGEKPPMNPAKMAKLEKEDYQKLAQQNMEFERLLSRKKRERKRS